MRRSAPLLLGLAFLAVSTAASAPRDNITLVLIEPQNCSCGWVSINGVVQSDGTLWGLVWDWGDGTRTTSSFPASHRYAADGDYEVVVTAVGCTNENAMASVQITNVTGSGCPTEASPECGAYPCRYLYPYNLHLTAGATSAAPLQARDASNNPVAGAMTFTPDDSSLVSVSAAGYVTALRTETSTQIGTWIRSTIDGGATANTCVARVLPTNYSVSFLESVGATTALYYPDVVKGENIGALVQQYQIPTVNEYAYAIESELMDSRPFAGCRQIFEVDFGVTEQSRICGISGNPIRLGWNIEGNDWQNCFLVPFFAPRSPQWTVFYHELGHNFTWASSVFGQALGTVHYSEGLATVMSLAAIDRILLNPARYPVAEATRTSLKYLYDRDRAQDLQAYQAWLSGGASFAALDPDIVDGIWLQYAGANVSRFAGRFFPPLSPAQLDGLGGVLCGMNSDVRKHTFFAALMSAAAGEDLSATFLNTYHYPLDQALFDTAYAAFTGTLSGISAGRVPGDGPGPPLTVSKVGGGNITLSWAPSCLASDTDYAVYEGTVRQFTSHQPRLCSTGGAITRTLTPSAGNTYYVVTPRTSTREGSYGTTSSGSERPQGASACAPQTIDLCQ